MPDAILFIGTQATGKSSFYQQRFARTHVRINMDMLRTRHRESRLLELCLETEQSFVVDNTNPTMADRGRYLERIAKRKMFSVVGYYFQSEIAMCLERNANRSAEERVPDLGVKATHSKLQLPEMQEGFDELYFVQMAENGQFTVSAWQQ